MNKPHPQPLLVCLDCGAGIPAGGTCPLHPDEPLFDPSLPEIQEEMEALDTRRTRNITAFWSSTGAIIGFGYGLPVALMVVPSEQANPVFIVWVAALFGAPSIILFNYLGRKLGKARFARFTRNRQKYTTISPLEELEGLGYSASLTSGIEAALDIEVDTDV